MIEFLNWFDFTSTDWLISLACGILIGTAKAGVAGTGIMIVPIMAIVFGGRVSTGIVLPMLIIADVYAVFYYNRFANWRYIAKIMPWAIIGIFAGLAVGNWVSDAVFRKILSITVILAICIMIWRDFRQNVTIPDYWWFAMLLGLAGGFATMIGNAAGPVMAMYLLAMRIPKLSFIGTGAWFFFLVNLFKVPLHVFVWETITLKTITFNLIVAPAILLGVFLGIQIVKILPEKLYRILIIGTTMVSAFLLI